MIKMNKKRHGIVVGGTAVIFSIMLLLSNAISVIAASKSIVEVAIVPGEDEVMDAEYEFIAKFIEGVTTVTTFGEGWRSVKQSETDERLSWAIVPTTAQKGEVGVVYHHVGLYEGKAISLKITINDWEGYANNPGNISYRQGSIGHNHQGYNWVDQSWEFLDSETGEPVAVTGYFTINDIDHYQAVAFDQETSNAFTNIYVSGEDNWLQFDDAGGVYKFSENNGSSSDTYDPRAMFTFSYKNRAKINFKWMEDHEKSGRSKDWVCDVTQTYGTFFGFIAKKPLKTATAIPVKRVSDVDEAFVVKNELGRRDEKFTYTITHTVPDEWEEFYYQSYVLKDTVAACLEVEEVTVRNLEGEDVTSWFDISVDGNELTANARAERLGNANFYHETYIFSVTAMIKAEADLTSYQEGETCVLRNTATVDIDGNGAESNEVETELGFYPVTPEIVKKIMVGTELVESHQARKGELLSFYGQVKIPNKKLYKPIQIVDQLHPAFSFQQMKVYDANGQEITTWGDISGEQNRIVFAVKEEYLPQVIGTELEFNLEVQVDALADLSQLEGGRIPNVYQLQLDGEIHQSNDVYVTVEKNQGDEMETPPETIADAISKVIVDQQGQEVTALALTENSQDITFSGMAQINNQGDALKVVLEDDLHPAFAFKKDSLKVYDQAQREITNQGETEEADQKVRFVFNEDYAKMLRGQQISWELTVNYIEGSDLSELADKAIPNTMSLQVDEQETTSDEVTVTPVPLKNSMVKYIVDANGELITQLKLKDRKEVITFRGKANIANDVKIEKVVLKDQLSKSFVVDQASIQVFDGKGTDITAQGQIALDAENTLTFSLDGSAAQQLAGQMLTWNFSVRLAEDADVTTENTITNKMSLLVNGVEIESKKVKVVTAVERVIKKPLPAKGIDQQGTGATPAKQSLRQTPKTGDNTEVVGLLIVLGLAITAMISIHIRKVKIKE